VRVARAAAASGSIPTASASPRFVRYLADPFWQDEDSGHWEETRKISASSIGVVVAGLREWLALMGVAQIAPDARTHRRQVTEAVDLIDRGRAALAAILPGECAQLSPDQNRRYDAALVFLLHPLGVIDGPMADLLLSDVRRMLTGQIGIRRYLGDSYWAPDYDTRARADRLATSVTISRTRRLLERIGDKPVVHLDPMPPSSTDGAWRAARRDRDAQGGISTGPRPVMRLACPALFFARWAWVNRTRR
jgi:hypothetical protein